MGPCTSDKPVSLNVGKEIDPRARLHTERRWRAPSPSTRYASLLTDAAAPPSWSAKLPNVLSHSTCEQIIPETLHEPPHGATKSECVMGRKSSGRIACNLVMSPPKELVAHAVGPAASRHSPSRSEPEYPLSELQYP